MTENLRFIAVIDALRAQGVIADYVQIAKELNTYKASISDIKSGRKKPSIELLRCLKKSYPEVSLDYIIMGDGTMFEEVRKSTEGESMSQFLQLIKEQAEEIGRLKEQLAQRGSAAANASDKSAALAG